jgi:hypothetical protein
MTLGVMTTLAVGSACSSSDSPLAQTSAFRAGKPLTTRITVAPGDVWSYMIADAKSDSTRPVDLQQVDLATGTGPGRVSVRPAEVAPLPDDPGDQRGWTPSGIFKTYPPTLLIPGGNCNVQRLAAVRGYQLEPGDEIRFLFAMRSETAGTTTFADLRMIYTEAGQTHKQILPTSLVVTSRRAHPLPMGFSEKPCAHLAQVLPSGA